MKNLYGAEVIADVQVDAEVNMMILVVLLFSMPICRRSIRISRLMQHVFSPLPLTRKRLSCLFFLPDAIQNVGVFTLHGVLSNYIVAHFYPENVMNEGRLTQIWPFHQYMAYVLQPKALGIPVKSVDTRLEAGSTWWTYEAKLVYGH